MNRRLDLQASNHVWVEDRSGPPPVREFLAMARKRLQADLVVHIQELLCVARPKRLGLDRLLDIRLRISMHGHDL